MTETARVERVERSAEQYFASLGQRRWRWAVGSDAGYVTAADLKSLYEFIAEAGLGCTQGAIAVFLGVPTVTHRKADIALQKLRKAGLTRFDRPRIWAAVREVPRG